MTFQTYNKIKYVYNGLLSVELDYNKNYEVGDIYYFNNDYECIGIIRRIRFCPNYKEKGKIFLTLQLI